MSNFWWEHVPDYPVVGVLLPGGWWRGLVTNWDSVGGVLSFWGFPEKRPKGTENDPDEFLVVPFTSVMALKMSRDDLSHATDLIESLVRDDVH